MECVQYAVLAIRARISVRIKIKTKKDCVKLVKPKTQSYFYVVLSKNRVNNYSFSAISVKRVPQIIRVILIKAYSSIEQTT